MAQWPSSVRQWTLTRSVVGRECVVMALPHISRCENVRPATSEGTTGQFPTPKFSKACFAVRYSNKLQYSPPPNVSGACGLGERVPRLFS